MGGIDKFLFFQCDISNSRGAWKTKIDPPSPESLQINKTFTPKFVLILLNEHALSYDCIVAWKVGDWFLQLGGAFFWGQIAKIWQESSVAS